MDSVRQTSETLTNFSLFSLFNQTAVGTHWIASPKILLVDDDRVIQMLSCKLLQSFGCMPEIASDGEEAVEKMKTQNYDLVFMVGLGTSFSDRPLT